MQLNPLLIECFEGLVSPRQNIGDEWRLLKNEIKCSSVEATGLAAQFGAHGELIPIGRSKTHLILPGDIIGPVLSGFALGNCSTPQFVQDA